jgi:hypothetical protein
MTPRAPVPNSLSKEFVKILSQGFWLPAPTMIKPTLTPADNPLKLLTPKSAHARALP